MVKSVPEVNDYNDLLNTAWDEIPEIKLLPTGSYLLKGKNASFQAPKQEGQNAKVLFFYIPVDAIEVDAEALAELGDDYDISENQVVYTIWIENSGDWNKVREHLAKHGIEDGSQSIGDSLKKSFRGTQVVGHIDIDTYTPKGGGETRIQNKVDNFAAVE